MEKGDRLVAAKFDLYAKLAGLEPCSTEAAEPEAPKPETATAKAPAS